MSRDTTANLSWECRTGSRSLNMLLRFIFLAKQMARDNVTAQSGSRYAQQLLFIANKDGNYGQGERKEAADNERFEFQHAARNKSGETIKQHQEKIGGFDSVYGQQKRAGCKSNTKSAP